MGVFVLFYLVMAGIGVCRTEDTPAGEMGKLL